MKYIKKWFIILGFPILIACNAQNSNTISVKIFGDSNAKIILMDNNIFSGNLKYIIESASTNMNIFLYFKSKSKERLEVSNLSVNLKWRQNKKITNTPYKINTIEAILNHKENQIADTNFLFLNQIEQRYKILNNLDYSAVYNIQFSDPNYNSIPQDVNSIYLNVEFDIIYEGQSIHYVKNIYIDAHTEVIEAPIGRND